MLGMQVRYTEIAILSQLAPPRAIRTASAIHPVAATDRGELMTLIAGKRQRQRLFMAADDDEVSRHNKKRQRNVTLKITEQHLIARSG